MAAKAFFGRPELAVVLCAIMFALSFADRSLSSGAFQQIQSFISADLDVVNTAAEFGAMSGGAIAGYAVSAVVCGFLSHYINHFVIMAGAATILTLSTIISGLAPHFWLLMIGRCISGVGEAAFIVLVPAFIQDTFEPHRRGFWTALLFSGLPLGFAIGPLYGAYFAQQYSWRAAYLCECVLLVPVIIMLLLVSRHQGDPHRLGYDEQVKRESAQAVGVDLEPLLIANNSILEVEQSVNGGGEERNPREPRHSCATYTSALWVELVIIGSSKPYWLVVLGYAALLAVFSGTSPLSGVILVGLKLVDSEKEAAIVLSVIIAVGGTIGAILGGVLVDRGEKTTQLASPPAVGHGESLLEPGVATDEATVNVEAWEEGGITPALRELRRQLHAFRVLVFTSILSLAVFEVSAATSLLPGGVYSYIICNTVGTITLMALLPIAQIALMLTVPRQYRPLAMGVGQIMTHAVGDVPASPIIGAMLDRMAPQTCTDPHDQSTCTRPPGGVQTVLLYVYAWLGWTIATWAAAYMLARHRKQQLLLHK